MTFVPVSDALNRLRSQSQKLNIYSLNVMSQLKDAKHKMKRIIDGLDPSASKAKLEIQTKFGGIVDLIQSRQQQLLDYVENEVRIVRYSFCTGSSFYILARRLWTVFRNSPPCV